MTDKKRTNDKSHATVERWLKELQLQNYARLTLFWTRHMKKHDDKMDESCSICCMSKGMISEYQLALTKEE